MLFWSQIPLFRVLLPFVFGILMFPFLKGQLLIQNFVFAFSVLLAILLFSFLRLKSYRNRWVFGLMLNFTLFLMGLFYVTQYQQKQLKVNLPIQQKVECLAKVSEILKHTDTSSRSIVVVKAISNNNRLERTSGFVLLYLKDTMHLSVGDELVFSTYFNRIQAAQNPAAFDYAQYMENKGVYYQAYVQSVYKVAHQQSLFAFAGKMRKKLIHNYQSMGFHGENLAVLIAITLGDKSYLEKALKTQYAKAGAMHILAVSGLHLGIVFLLFSFLLSPLLRLPFGKLFRGLLLILILWFFALLTGFSPSVQRAGIMFSFIVIAQMLHYNPNTLNSIFGSALLMLVINPLLIFEVGFQLSYAAVIGIVWLHPIVYHFFTTRFWLIDKIWSLVVVSIAAQLATLPLVLYYFHQFPNWFLLTNIFVIPLAFFIVAGGIVGVLLYTIFAFSLGLNYLVDFSLSLLNFIIKSLNNLPFFISSEIWITPFTAILVAMAIIALMLYLEKVKSFYLNVFLSFILLALVLELSMDIGQMHKSSFGIYAFKGESVYVYINGLKATLFCQDTLNRYSKDNIASHLHKIGIRKISNSSINQNYLKEDYSCLHLENYTAFSFKDKLILFSNKNQVQLLDAMESFDYLVLNQHNKWISESDKVGFNKPKVILDASILPWDKSYSRLEKLKNVYFVNKAGYIEID